MANKGSRMAMGHSNSPYSWRAGCHVDGWIQYRWIDRWMSRCSSPCKGYIWWNHSPTSYSQKPWPQQTGFRQLHQHYTHTYTFPFTLSWLLQQKTKQEESTINLQTEGSTSSRISQKKSRVMGDLLLFFIATVTTQRRNGHTNHSIQHGKPSSASNGEPLIHPPTSLQEEGPVCSQGQIQDLAVETIPFFSERLNQVVVVFIVSVVL